MPSAVRAVCRAVDLAVTGDWVAVVDAEAIDVPLIEAVLPRAGAITRGDPGEDSDVQVLAADVDTVSVVTRSRSASTSWR